MVGTIGVIARRKGTDLFAEAARLIQEETDEVSFRVVGRPDDPLDQAWAEEVLSRMASLGIHQADRADVYEELAKLDVFVLPSRSDPFPIVVLEAMATGLPVVGTRVDGIAEELDERSGLLVEPEDPRGLADAILRLHRDLQLRGSLGAGARTRVAESFGLDRQADALEACYLAAISGD